MNRPTLWQLIRPTVIRPAAMRPIVIVGSVMLAAGGGATLAHFGWPFAGGMALGGTLVWWLCDYLAYDAFMRSIGRW